MPASPPQHYTCQTERQHLTRTHTQTHKHTHTHQLHCNNEGERIMSFLMSPVSEYHVADETSDFTVFFLSVIGLRRLMKSNCVFYALEALLRKPLLSLQSLDSTPLSPFLQNANSISVNAFCSPPKSSVCSPLRPSNPSTPPPLPARFTLQTASHYCVTKLRS